MAEVPAPFGKYYLTEKLAAGGMAEIYLGKLVGPGGFEKLLVIKQIHPRFGGLRHFVDLFVAEAKTLVGLVHGNIVPVYELGVIGDTYYIAMEYIDGPSLYRLAEQLRAADTTMAPALAAHIATKILDGLDYAHRKGEGVIHRDLSSRNVMVSRDGEVKIVDFGIAVTLGDAGDHAGELPAGSFPYMSPEQVRRQPLTGQSDLFSVGILLWEMLTGQRLFARDDAAATMAAVLEAEVPPPSALNPAVPGRLDDVVLKAMHRDTEQRWSSAAEMLAALHRYLYSLAATPGARELSQLVSRYCPPSVRRHHTDADATPRRPATEIPVGELNLTAAGAESAAGPSTAVMPRAPGSQPLRQQAFATHVELAGLLPADAAVERLTDAPAEAPPRAPGGSPSGSITAVHAPARPATARSAAGPVPQANLAQAEATAAPAAARARGRDAARVDDGDDARLSTASQAQAEPPPPDPPPRLDEVVSKPSTSEDAPAPARALGADAPAPTSAARRLLPALALSLLALAALGGLWWHARAGSPRSAEVDAGGVVAASPDAAPRASDDAAAPTPPDAVPDAAPLRATADAAPLRATVDAAPLRATVDAAAPSTARRDAAVREPLRDAGRRAASPDAAPPAAQATIKVGANPWGEVLLDGRPVGRTPTTLLVPAGRHEVEVVFPVVDPPRRETYRVELGAGETRSVLADFSQ